MTAELDRLIAEQVRDMRSGNRVYREGDISFTEALASNGLVSTDMDGTVSVDRRVGAATVDWRHGAAAYRKLGCRCAVCRRASADQKARYRATRAEYVRRENESRKRRRAA